MTMTSTQPPADSLDVTKRDRFELLSAYLDGEVNPEERQLVNHWLAADHSAKCLYDRLLRLRAGIRTLPVESDCTLAETLSGVLSSLSRRFRLACMAGGGVIVMGTIGLLSGGFSPRQALLQSPLVANDPGAAGKGPAGLQVALDQPAFPIPKVSPSNGAGGAGFGEPVNSSFSVDSEL